MLTARCIHRAIVVVAALAVGLAAAPARATISTVDYLDMEPGYLYPGSAIKIRVTGKWVDTTSRVEVVKPGAGSNAASVMHTEIGALKRGEGSYVEITISPKSSNDPGEYEVRLRYPVETSGYDKFRTRLLDVGTINKIEMLNKPDQVLAGVTYKFRATGSSLELASLSHKKLVEIKASNYKATRNEPGVFEFEMQLDQPIELNLAQADFIDKNFPRNKTTLPPAALYKGQGGFYAAVQAHPILAAITDPPRPKDNQQVTVTGERLKPPGYSVTLRYRQRYGKMSPTGEPEEKTASATISDTEVKFYANKNMQPGSLRLVYTPDPSATGASSRLTTMFFPIAPNMQITGITPEIETAGKAEPLGGLNWDHIVVPGENTIRGRFLTSLEGQFQSVQAAITTVQVDGQPVQVKSVTYDSKALSLVNGVTMAGRDTLIFVMPDIPAPKRAEVKVFTGVTASRMSDNPRLKAVEARPAGRDPKSLLGETNQPRLPGETAPPLPRSGEPAKPKLGELQTRTRSAEQDDSPPVSAPYVINLMGKPRVTSFDGRRDAAGNLALRPGDRLAVDGDNLLFTLVNTDGTRYLAKPFVRIGDTTLPYNPNDHVTDYGILHGPSVPTAVTIAIKPEYDGRKVYIRTTAGEVEAGTVRVVPQ
jgi:hypothetical protein